MAIKQAYDPRQLMIAFGSHIPNAFPDGTFITIERHGDGVRKVVGADGSVARSVDPDNTATLTFHMRWDSDTAAWAQNQYDMDNLSGDGTFPVLIKDLRGGLVFSAEEAWIELPPDSEFALEMSEREIIIATGYATWNHRTGRAD